LSTCLFLWNIFFFSFFLGKKFCFKEIEFIQKQTAWDLSRNDVTFGHFKKVHTNYFHSTLFWLTL
jgi:hypothetical protein